MAWPVPQYSRNQVNKAGQILASTLGPHPETRFERLHWAYEVANNWRSCHGYPINTFQATLRQKLKAVAPHAIVAQRLKRMPSIMNKLQRLESMQLSRMQDIGGLRAVVTTLAQARHLEQNYRDSHFRHQLVTSRDYISAPKVSGYRSIHLVYRYGNARAPQYDGLFVELQIRTHLQHTWATAVETMGTFLNHALKSSEGPQAWLDFFALTGAAFAHLEGTPPVPGYEQLTRDEAFDAVTAQAASMRVHEVLLAFTIAAERVHADRGSGSYHLVVLDPVARNVTIHSYGQLNLEAANDEYAAAEQRIAAGEPLQAVLVSAGSIEELRRAYPNYFLDTNAFVAQLRRLKRR
jgi:putative GTP pyrophosphokinase